MKSPDTDKTEYPITKVIEDVKNGTVRFRDMEEVVRKEIVGVLSDEGLKTASIAQTLKCSSKTIQRIRGDIRKDHQIEPSSGLGAETIGELQRFAYLHWAALTRIANSPSSSTRERIDANIAAYNIIRDYVEQLRSVGYMPSAVQEISSKVSHSIEGLEGKSWDEFRVEIERIRIAARDSQKMTPELEQELFKIGEHIDKVQVGEKIENIIQQGGITPEGEHHG